MHSLHVSKVGGAAFVQNLSCFFPFLAIFVYARVLGLFKSFKVSRTSMATWKKAVYLAAVLWLCGYANGKQLLRHLH